MRRERSRYQIGERLMTLPDLNEQGMTPLRQYRADRRMTHIEFAEMLGISAATLYRYEETGIRNLSIANEVIQRSGGKLSYSQLLPDFREEYAT